MHAPLKRRETDDRSANKPLKQGDTGWETDSSSSTAYATASETDILPSSHNARKRRLIKQVKPSLVSGRRPRGKRLSRQPPASIDTHERYGRIYGKTFLQDHSKAHFGDNYETKQNFNTNIKIYATTKQEPQPNLAAVAGIAAGSGLIGGSVGGFASGFANSVYQDYANSARSANVHDGWSHDSAQDTAMPRGSNSNSMQLPPLVPTPTFAADLPRALPLTSSVGGFAGGFRPLLRAGATAPFLFIIFGLCIFHEIVKS